MGQIKVDDGFMRELNENAEKTGKQPSPLTTIATKEEWTTLKKSQTPVQLSLMMFHNIIDILA